MQHRILAAIMFTDIVGYTTLMGKDEDKAFKILDQNLKLQQFLIGKYQGRFLKQIGDGILASFSSAYDAVLCAKSIIKVVKEETDFKVRIGIHEGDVIFKGGDVYGDGVNIASRLQGEAIEGCICISDSVYKNVKNKTDIKTQFFEEKALKNIDNPIKIYTITEENLQITTPEDSDKAKGEPAQKSIIVLPFENISSDQEQEYFSDGLTEEIITDLSFIHDLLVISRSSAMTYKGTKKKIREIAQEVNVRYVLEGSVRKAGNNLRIIAQLIDGISDTHLWAEKYSGTLDDIFDIQEKVSQAIVNALKLRLSGEEKRKLTERPIEDPLAYEYYLKAREEQLKFTKEGLDNALRYLQKGLDTIGENVRILGGIGYVYYQYVNVGIWTDDKYIKMSEDNAQKIFRLEPDSPYGHLILGLLKIWWRNPQEGISHLKKVLMNYPNDFDALLWLTAIHSILGKNKIALTYVNRFIEIDPLNSWSHWLPGWMQLWDGKCNEALEAIIKFCQKFPDLFLGKWSLGITYTCTNNFKEACSTFEKLEQEMPGYSFSEIGLKFIAAIKGDKKKALLWRKDEHEVWAWRDLAISYFVSQAYSLAGLTEEALKWLEHAVNLGMINYPFISEYDPSLENIRNELRFKKLIKRIKYEWENFEI